MFSFPFNELSADSRICPKKGERRATSHFLPFLPLFSAAQAQERIQSRGDDRPDPDAVSGQSKADAGHFLPLPIETSWKAKKMISFPFNKLSPDSRICPKKGERRATSHFLPFLPLFSAAQAQERIQSRGDDRHALNRQRQSLNRTERVAGPSQPIPSRVIATPNIL
ncbi:MAG: hypothetical protein WCY08_01810 [Rhodocyclaceae bacterium]